MIYMKSNRIAPYYWFDLHLTRSYSFTHKYENMQQNCTNDKPSL